MSDLSDMPWAAPLTEGESDLKVYNAEGLLTKPGALGATFVLASDYEQLAFRLRDELTACQLARDRLQRDLEEVTCGDPRIVCPTCQACRHCGRASEVCAKLGLYGLGSKCCERCSHVPQTGDKP